MGVALSLPLSPPPGSAHFCSPRYGGGSFSFSRLISSVTQRFSSEFELQQVRLDLGDRGLLALAELPFASSP